MPQASRRPSKKGRDLMNVPTLIGALIILVIFVAIVGRGIYNRKHGKSGCSCGGDCGCCGGACHSK